MLAYPCKINKQSFLPAVVLCGFPTCQCLSWNAEWLWWEAGASAWSEITFKSNNWSFWLFEGCDPITSLSKILAFGNSLLKITPLWWLVCDSQCKMSRAEDMWCLSWMETPWYESEHGNARTESSLGCCYDKIHLPAVKYLHSPRRIQGWAKCFKVDSFALETKPFGGLASAANLLGVCSSTPSCGICCEVQDQTQSVSTAVI